MHELYMRVQVLVMCSYVVYIYYLNISAYESALHFYGVYIYIYIFAYNISFISIVNNRIHLLVLPLICIIYALKCVMLCIYVYKSHIDEYYIHKCMYNACKLHENVLLGGLLNV